MTDEKLEALADEAEAAEIEEVTTEPVPEPEPVPEFVTLHMGRSRPEDLGYEDPNANLVYGPFPRHTPEGLKGNIRFINRTAVVPADHPLLDEVLKKFPVEIVTTEDKAKVWMDPDTGKEYKSKKALQAALRAKKSKRKG